MADPWGQVGTISSWTDAASKQKVKASAPPKKRKKKDDDRGGIGGFFENLGDDIKDLAGIPAGLWELGKSAVHDAGKAAGMQSGEYRLDDAGKAIMDSYKYTYGPLFKGEFKKFGSRLYAHPLAPMLDAASLVTGGGATAGKLATTAAKNTGNATAMRIAGLQRVDAITPSTVRGVSGPAGKFAAATRPIKDPLTGVTLHEMPVVRNPVIRSRKNLMEGAYSKLPASSYMSTTRRGNRLGEAQHNRIAVREHANVDRAYREAYAKLKKDEKDALFYIAQGFNNPDRATILLKQRRDAAAQMTAAGNASRIADRSRTLDKAAKRGDLPKGKRAKPVTAEVLTKSDTVRAGADNVDLIRDARAIERAMPIIAAPNKNVLAALEAQRRLNELTQAMFIREKIRGGMTEVEAIASGRARAEGPLRAVGITPDSNEVLVSLTHVENAAKRDARGGNLERGMTTRTLDEERATEYANFLNARYDRDATTALLTHRRMFAKEKTLQRIERAIGNAVPFEHAKHHADTNNGKLHWIKKDDPLIRDMKYVDDSLDRFEAQIGDFTDVEIEAIRDAYNAMYDLINNPSSEGMVMSTAHYQELIGQFSGAKGILEKITDAAGKLTKPWRHIVLSLKGSFYVNNFIGNLLLGVVAYGPRYIFDVAQESLPKAMRGATSTQISDNVSDLTRTSAANSIGELSRAGRMDVISRLGEKVAAKGSKLTEDNFRRGAFRTNLRKYEKQYRDANPGMTRHQAIEAIFNDKKAVDQLAEMTYSDLLDYNKLTPVERELLLSAMPFWNFVRSMTGRTVRLTLDEPWKMRVLLYFGQSGLEANAEAFNNIDLPHYLEGLIRLDKTGETQRVMSSYGLNPFVAPADLVQQLMSFASEQGGSQNPLAAFNPLWKVPLESIMDKDFFMGREIEAPDGSLPSGTFGRMAVQARKNIPQLGMYDRYRYPSSRPAIERDLSDTVAQYFGAPIGTLNPQNIEETNAIVAAMEARDAAYREKRQEAIAERARF